MNFLACRAAKMETHCVFSIFKAPIGALDHGLPTERTLQRALDLVY